MVTSMREHKGYLFVGGILNNRIGRYKLDGADPELDRHRLLLGSEAVILDPILDLFRGEAVTIPPMDGAFRPNTRLDEAPLWPCSPRPTIWCRQAASSWRAAAMLFVSIEPGGRADDRRDISPHRSPRSPSRRQASVRSGWSPAQLIVDGREEAPARGGQLHHGAGLRDPTVRCG